MNTTAIGLTGLGLGAKVLKASQIIINAHLSGTIKQILQHGIQYS